MEFLPLIFSIFFFSQQWHSKNVHFFFAIKHHGNLQFVSLHLFCSSTLKAVIFHFSVATIICHLSITDSYAFEIKIWKLKDLVENNRQNAKDVYDRVDDKWEKSAIIIRYSYFWKKKKTLLSKSKHHSIFERKIPFALEFYWKYSTLLDYYF